MINIRMNNVQSRVTGLSPTEMGTLQKLISYQHKVIPPDWIRLLIRTSGITDWVDFRSTFRSQLQDGGWYGLLTEQMFDDVRWTRAPGWDGWKSMVNRGGYFGTGLVDYVMRALSLRMGLGRPYIVDERTRPRYAAQDISGLGLFDFQQEAINAWVNAGGRGVLDLPPRSGKTRIMIAICRMLGLPTIIVVPKVQLVEQTVDKFLACGFEPHEVVGITGGRPNRKVQTRMRAAFVWVATPQTAAGPKPKGRWDPYPGLPGSRTRKMLMIDEFHHAAAKTWQNVSTAYPNAYFRLGATGTFFRSDNRHLPMYAVLSKAVYSKTVEDMVALGRLAPGKVIMCRVPGKLHVGMNDRLYSVGVAKHEQRNALLLQATQRLIANGKRVLVLSREVAHARAFAGALGSHALQVDGADNSKVGPALEALAEGRVPCVVGTSVIGEGTDVPSADALVYLAGGKSKVSTVQNYFRVLTASAGKSHGVIVDAADNHHDGLVRSAAQRLGLYRRCFTAEVVDPGELDGAIDRVA